MATPPLLNLEEFLQPIPGDRPSGRNLAYEPEYDAIRAARRADDDAPQGDWQRPTKAAEWGRVVALGTDLLKTRTKDLQIAAWVAEAMARVHGFAGLRDGLALVRLIQDRFWDSYYPEIDDGDLDSRSGPFLFLDATLPLVVRSIPLTDGFAEVGYPFLKWAESRATDNAGARNAELRDALIAEGKITGAQFDEQAAQTPRSFYETLHDDLIECLEAFDALDRANDEHFGRDAPSLGNVRKAIEDCRRPVASILAARPEEPAETESGDETPAPEPAGEAEGDSWPPVALEPKRPQRRASSGPMTGPQDARARIVEAAADLRKNEPGSAVPYLVVRALRAGELFGQPRPPDASQAEAPSTETRQALRRLATEGDWADLLEQAEEALGRPEGRAWLDAHRFALLAMDNAGDADRSAASTAARAFLRALLAEFPTLPDGELNDGTPTASAETRAWLRESVVAQAARAVPVDPIPPLPEPEPEPAPTADRSAEPDAWDEAIEAVRAGRTGEGFERLRRAMQSARSGRERFLRKLQLAELCLMVNNPRLALPLAEDLARQVDEFRLEGWEDDRLCARVWEALYRGLGAATPADGQAERARDAFSRLCRLDIGRAMTLGGAEP